MQLTETNFRQDTIFVFESHDEDIQFKNRMYCDYIRGKYQNVL